MGDEEEYNGYITVNEAQALVQQRFFPAVDEDEYDRRAPEDVLRKLFKDAGITLLPPRDKRSRFDSENYVPHPALKYGGYSSEQILEMLDLLLEAHHRSDTYDGRRGTTRIHQLPYDYVEHLFLQIEQSLQQKEKEPALPRLMQKPQKKVLRRDSAGLYPDVDGSLKRAFCEGLGVDPEAEPKNFVAMFRDWIKNREVCSGIDKYNFYQKIMCFEPLDITEVGGTQIPCDRRKLPQIMTAVLCPGLLPTQRGSRTHRFIEAIDSVRFDWEARAHEKALFTVDMARTVGAVLRIVLRERLAARYGEHFHPATEQPAFREAESVELGAAQKAVNWPQQVKSQLLGNPPEERSR